MTSPAEIQKFFATIATQYDRNNALLSFGLFRKWNRALVKAVAPSAKDDVLLDLCSGTGDIAIDYLNFQKGRQQVVMLDFCSEMLQIAQQKTSAISQDHQLRFVVADAQEIPLPAHSVGAVSMAYGIRNVADPVKCAQEVKRVLKPGGTWAILELTRPTWPIVRQLHAFHLRYGVPLLGQLFSNNWSAYKYLSTSVGNFVSPETLSQKFSQVGFKLRSCHRLCLGAATVLSFTH